MQADLIHFGIKVFMMAYFETGNNGTDIAVAVDAAGVRKWDK